MLQRNTELSQWYKIWLKVKTEKANMNHQVHVSYYFKYISKGTGLCRLQTSTQEIYVSYLHLMLIMFITPIHCKLWKQFSLEILWQRQIKTRQILHVSISNVICRGRELIAIPIVIKYFWKYYLATSVARKCLLQKLNVVFSLFLHWSVSREITASVSWVCCWYTNCCQPSK